jgi:hypothetical protein
MSLYLGRKLQLREILWSWRQRRTWFCNCMLWPTLQIIAQSWESNGLSLKVNYIILQG